MTAPRTPEARFEVWQDGMMVADSIGPRDDALRAAQHYALVYSQDAPVDLMEVLRGRRVLLAHVTTLSPARTADAGPGIPKDHIADAGNMILTPTEGAPS